MHSGSSPPSPPRTKNKSRTNFYIEIPHYPGGRIPNYGPIPEVESPGGPILAHRRNVKGPRGEAKIVGTVILPLCLPSDIDPKTVRRELAYLVTWKSLPTVKIAVPGTDILDYTTPRELEDYEYEQWCKKEDEKDLPEKKPEEAPVKAGGKKKAAQVPAKRPRKRAALPKNSTARILPPQSPPRTAVMSSRPSLSTPQKSSLGLQNMVPGGELTESDMDIEGLQWDIGDEAAIMRQLEGESATEKADRHMRRSDRVIQDSMSEDDDEESLVEEAPRKKSRGLDTASSTSRSSRPEFTVGKTQGPAQPPKPASSNQIHERLKLAIEHTTQQNRTTANPPVVQKPAPSPRPTATGKTPSRLVGPQELGSGDALLPQVTPAKMQTPAAPAQGPRIAMATPFLLTKNKHNPSTASDKKPNLPQPTTFTKSTPKPTASMPPPRKPNGFTPAGANTSRKRSHVPKGLSPTSSSDMRLKDTSLSSSFSSCSSSHPPHLPQRGNSSTQKSASSIKKKLPKPAVTSPLPSKVAKLRKQEEEEQQEEQDEEEGEEQDPEWEIQRLESDKYISGIQHFRVRWKGNWPPDQNPTWEPKANIDKSLVKAYLARKKQSEMMVKEGGTPLRQAKLGFGESVKRKKYASVMEIFEGQEVAGDGSADGFGDWESEGEVD